MGARWDRKLSVSRRAHRREISIDGVASIQQQWQPLILSDVIAVQISRHYSIDPDIA
jgi:hypothetical protein